MQHFLSRLQGQMASNWNQPALCDYQGDKFTFGDLAKHVARFHVLFHKLGLKKGDKVAICGKNQARWGISFFASITYETVAVPILDNFHIDNISNIINLSESLVVIVDPEIWKKLENIPLPMVKQVISMRDFTPLKCSEEDKTVFENLDNLFQEAYPQGFTSADVNYPTDNDKDLCTGTSYKGDFPKFVCSGKLKLLYEWLQRLGYEISTEEQSMMDGTHAGFHAKEAYDAAK